jgi:hypothetical protein
VDRRPISYLRYAAKGAAVGVFFMAATTVTNLYLLKMLDRWDDLKVWSALIYDEGRVVPLFAIVGVLIGYFRSRNSN